MKILQAKTRFKVAKYDNSYTVFFAGSIWTDGLVITASRSESGDMGTIFRRDALCPFAI